MNGIRATYRLQVHAQFRLSAVNRLIDYFAALGVSHLYLSPVLRARHGSNHGYDQVDPRAVNPEIGSEREFRRLAARLRRRGIGIVLDIVPNHMAMGHENPYWEDVLMHGVASRFARWFDVDWHGMGRGARGPGGPAHILLAVLGDELPTVLSRGELRLVFDQRAAGAAGAAGGLGGTGGAYRLAYHDQTFPLDPATVPLELRAVRSARAAQRKAAAFSSGTTGGRRLQGLLDLQHYRLVYWRQAARELNYRRFFTISELVGLRIEDPEVWEALHVRPLEWRRDGVIAGLRIDHIDGLADPLEYLGRLADAAPMTPVYVEKILAREERLRNDWPVAGTTGYEFGAAIDDVFIHPQGFARLEQFYRRLVPRPASFAAAAEWGKRRLLERQLVAEVRRLTARLEALLQPRSASRAELAIAIQETIVHLGVYRTYIDHGPEAELDRATLRGALAAARSGGRAAPAALRGLAAALLGRTRDVGFAQRFQQLCVSATAKGVEDTALYLYPPLVSRNEVGAAPNAPLDDAKAVLHRDNVHRASRWPCTMLSVTTHDTKWSADVRARISVLSELPETWFGYVRRWRAWHRSLKRPVRGRPAPDAHTEYLLYQATVGIWPAGARPPERAMVEHLRQRIEEYVVKAAKEAKRRTGWVRPDPEYEEVLRAFTRAVLSARNGRFLAELQRCVVEVARPGFWNALSRTLVHLTAPGVPDTYQGDELWNFSLVDPDNRRPIDFRLRLAVLRRLAATGGRGGNGRGSIERLARTLEDGRLKLALIRAALRARARADALFATGVYRPLAVQGPAADHAFAFLRSNGRQTAITVIPRLVKTLMEEATGVPSGALWHGTRVLLPRGVGTGGFRDVLTGQALPSGGGAALDLQEVFARLPLALLLRPAP